MILRKFKLIPLFLLVLFLSCTFIFGSSGTSGYEHIPLPKIDEVKWVTNLKEKKFTSNQAKKGGIFRDFLSDFPLTFRLYGPESNSGDFITYKRKYAFLSLVTRHPVTFEFVPELATHWALMDDQKTAYYHLDPDARWSDGKPITANDYVYVMKFFLSDHLKAPFYKQYYSENFESIEKINDLVVKIVRKKKSWNLLDDTNISPIPEHDTKLDKDWLTTYQWKMPVVPGPYALDSFEKGKSITFKRIKNWWGENKKYMKNMFNFDQIELKVVRSETSAFLLFKKGELDTFNPDPPKWARETNFNEIKKGYILKRKIRKRTFSGASGIFFNVQDEIWSDRNLRKAFAHVFDFETSNKKFMFNLYDRRHTFFMPIEPYLNTEIKSYPFDVAEAEKILDKSGWKREKGAPIRSKDGVNLKLTLNYGGDRLDQQLPYLKETALKAGIDLELKKLDPSALYKTWGDKSYTATILGFGGGFYPSPRQMFHTENISKNSNNINMFGNKEVDKLIETLEFNLDEKKRVDAINAIEQIVHDEALVVFFWFNPYTLLLNWRYIKGPDNYITKSGLNIDYLWIDDKEKKNLLESRKRNKHMEIPKFDSDPYQLSKQ